MEWSKINLIHAKVFRESSLQNVSRKKCKNLANKNCENFANKYGIFKTSQKFENTRHTFREKNVRENILAKCEIIADEVVSTGMTLILIY